jgi:hypothetical protein
LRFPSFYQREHQQWGQRTATKYSIDIDTTTTMQEFDIHETDTVEVRESGV